jgi:hypothetical protein
MGHSLFAIKHSEVSAAPVADYPNICWLESSISPNFQPMICVYVCQPNDN